MTGYVTNTMFDLAQWGFIGFLAWRLDLTRRELRRGK